MAAAPSTTLLRRFWTALCCAVVLGATLPALADGPIRIRDVEGREVVLPGPAKRILLGDGHLLVTLALLHPDPAGLVVASQGDMKRHSPDVWARFRQAAPAAVDRIAIVGEASPDTFSVEAALAAEPDLAIFGGTYGPSIRSKEVLDRLTAAGVPVIFVDMFTSPLARTAESVRTMAKAIGREREGEAFATFYERRLARITERVAGLAAPERPSVFLQAFGGVWDCCWTPGRAGLGEFLAAAGGRNLGDQLFPGRPWGQASLEYVLTENPDVYITTGNPHVARAGGVVLGAGVAGVVARQSLAEALKKTALAELPAIQGGRAFAIWHLLHGLPLNIVALEAFAKWLHPERFRDIDPVATMAEVNARFLSVSLPGTYLTGPE